MSRRLKTHNSIRIGVGEMMIALVIFVCLPVVQVSAQQTSGFGLSTLQSIVIKKKRFKRTVVDVLPQDEVWLVSARCSHLAPCDLSLIKVDRLEGGRWCSSSLESLVEAHATDKSKTTMIYAHGNRTDLSWARSRGLQLYSLALTKMACRRPPVRFVIFAWQSEQEVKCARDFLIKSKRSDTLGVTMARILTQFSDRKMVLIGFSLGAQVMVTALDQPSVTECFEQNPDRGQYRVAVIAPVLDGYASCRQASKYPVGEAVYRAEIYQNRKDRAVRVAGIIRRRQFAGRSKSISELAVRGNLPFGNVCVRELSKEMCRYHAVSLYARSNTVQAGLSQMLNETYAESQIQSVSQPELISESQ